MENLYYNHIVNYLIILITYCIMLIGLGLLHKFKNINIKYSIISSTCYFLM